MIKFATPKRTSLNRLKNGDMFIHTISLENENYLRYFCCLTTSNTDDLATIVTYSEKEGYKVSKVPWTTEVIPVQVEIKEIVIKPLIVF